MQMHAVRATQRVPPSTQDCSPHNHSGSRPLEQNNHGLFAVRRDLQAQRRFAIPVAQPLPAGDNVVVGHRLAGVFTAGDTDHMLRRETDQLNPDLATQIAKRLGADFDLSAASRQYNPGQIRGGTGFDNGFSHFHFPHPHHFFAPVDDHLWRINHVAATAVGIGFLAFGKFGFCENIFPADVIPVIHMQRQRDHITAFGQFPQQSIRRWAGRTALAGKQLDNDRCIARHRCRNSAQRYSALQQRPGANARYRCSLQPCRCSLQ